MLTGQNKFNTLQETFERPTLNDIIENFVISHKETAAGCIATKPIK